MKPTSIVLFAVFLGGLAPASVSSAAETQTVASFETTITKAVGYRYLLALPTGYDASADKVWPMILFLHGSGERGSDVWRVAIHGPPKLLRGDLPSLAPAPKGPPPPETTIKFSASI